MTDPAHAPPAPAPLEVAEQVARIERMQEETRKFVAEQHKLIAEAAKLRRDHGLAPWLLVVAGAGGAAGFLAAIITVLKSLGYL
jgi:hypothetical protein